MIASTPPIMLLQYNISKFSILEHLSSLYHQMLADDSASALRFLKLLLLLLLLPALPVSQSGGYGAPILRAGRGCSKGLQAFVRGQTLHP